VSPQTARIAILPRAVASEIVTSAVSRAAWAVSIAIILIDIPVVIDVFATREGIGNVPVPLATLVGMLGLLAYTGLRPGIASRIVFLGVGAVLAAAYQTSILLVDPSLADNASYLLNRPAFVLVLVSPGITRPLVGLVWTAVGFVVATGSLLVSDLIAGAPLVTGWGPTIALAIYSSAYLTIAGIRASQRNQLPDLARLEEETRRLALEHQYEQRAAAIVHDTVLNDLTVVMNARGVLDERTRERLRLDVATLGDAAWLRESRESIILDPADAELRNGMVSLVSEMQWRGLTVDVTGNPETEVLRLSPEKIAAIHDAVRACLENVLAHAGTRTVELVLGAEVDHATIMVIDQGVGFEPAAVPADRLGLRSSVVRRIESLGGSVRVWSSPGNGTSVMISMPCEVILPKTGTP
jgi:signal transduction histidine kinase